MDRKQIASGEYQEEQTPNPFMNEIANKLSKYAIQHGHDSDYLDGALEYLAAKTGKKFKDADERTYALMELAKYSRWKLQRLDEFVETQFSAVWKFLDKLEQVPEAYKAPDRNCLPEPETKKSRLLAEAVTEFTQGHIDYKEFCLRVKEISGEGK